MKLALLIYRYFPYGGQQRDMLAIARAALARGHAVTVYCHLWQGDVPEGLEVRRVPVRGWTNHNRMRRFGEAALKLLADNPPDLVLGFIKLPGLDAYYAADPCFADKAYGKRGLLYRLSPRSRVYLQLEREVFGADSRTRILEIARSERESFIRHYGTPEQRFHTLIPGISRTRIAPADYVEVRRRKRAELGLGAADRVLLALGSGFKTKGLDRSIDTLAELRRRGLPARLLVVGQDRAERFQSQARHAGVADQVQFLGGRDDIPELLQAADVLLHPAYRENTGTGLLEAMVAGLPVVATATCGYSFYIREAEMGVVVDTAAKPGEIADGVATVLQLDTDEWHRRGKLFAESADIYDLPNRVVDILESLVVSR